MFIVEAKPGRFVVSLTVVPNAPTGRRPRWLAGNLGAKAQAKQLSGGFAEEVARDIGGRVVECT
jgi:hypothetical protein